MRLQRLRLLNFRQHRDTDLEFGPGLTGIIGPNGAGKSTLLEAIAWAIYGMDAARGTRDSIRWRRAKPRSEVRVELEFGLGPHEYRVVRTLYGAELYLDRSPQPMTTSLAEVTTRLVRVLGMSRDEFFHTYFTGQKELAVMAAMKPTERGQFLSKLLGYDKLRLAQERVRVRRSLLKSELGALEQGRPDPAALRAARERAAALLVEAERQAGAEAERFGAAQAARERHAPAFREVAELRDRHLALVAERRLNEERVRQAVELAARLTSEHAAAAAAVAEQGALRSQLEPYPALRGRSRGDGGAGARRGAAPDPGGATRRDRAAARRGRAPARRGERGGGRGAGGGRAARRREARAGVARARVRGATERLGA